MKKQNRRRKLATRNSSNQRQSRYRRLSSLESLEVRNLLAGDLVLGPGTDDPLNELEVQIQLNEQEQSTDPLDERKTNNSIATAEPLPLGFDFGEFAAIDLRGEIIEPTAISIDSNQECDDSGCPARIDLLGNQIPPEEDGSFLFAETVGWEGGVQATFIGAIGDGLNGPNDADFYEFLDVDAGLTITAHLDSANNGLTLYNEFGQVLRTSDAISPFQSGDAFISFTVPEAGDYYIAVAPFEAPFTNDWFPPDPFIVGDVFPQQITVGENPYVLDLGVDAADVDYFALELEPGDILGVNGIGAVSVLSVFTPDQNLQYLAGQGQLGLPIESPLPTGGNVTAAYVAETAGTHFLKVESFFERGYLLETRLFRPPAEQELAGERQILFLDFDGANLNPELFGPPSQSSLQNLSPLSNFLGGWGLSSERQLVDAIVDVVDKDLNRDLQRINPDAGVTILNSLDHPDVFGQPNVSRIIVGGTQAQATIPTIGLANSIDVGNFDQEETAFVLLDLLAAGSNNPNSLNTFDVAAGASKVDLVAAGVGGIISHEAGHFYGAYHTDNSNNISSLMDSGGELWRIVGVGEDRVWGTSDDQDVGFANDEFALTEGFVGIQNVPGMLANILVSGNARVSPDGGTEPLPTLLGFVFNDINADGLQGPGETGLANVRVYIDVNNDGEFGISEPTAVSDGNGGYELPSNAGDGVIRLLLGPGQTLTSTSDDGSLAGVLSLTGDESGTDLGDAPASYGITSNDIQAGIRLGSAVDNDATSGSDSEDDGVSIGALAAGETGTVTITATTNGFAPGLVNGWIDFNNNGVFEGFENVVANGRLEGTETFSFQVPTNAITGETWARFRLGYLRDAGPTGDGGVGEVEDYTVNIAGINVNPVDPVDPGTGSGTAPIANSDIFDVTGGTSTSVNVLSNDSAGSEPVTIQAVGVSSNGSSVEISEDGLRLLYTPAADFTGTETVTYTIGSAIGTSTTTVTFNVSGGDGTTTDGDLVGFRLETVDLSDNPISSVAVGEFFNLNVYVDDLRPSSTAEGIFAAFLDVNFDDALADVEGAITFAPYFNFFQNPPNGDFSLLSPEDNDLGGSTRESSGIPEERLLMTLPFQANSAGVLEFTTDGPDNLPSREILLWPASAENVTNDRVDFGTATITITSTTAAFAPFMNPANRYDVNNDGFISPIDVKILIDNLNDFGARDLAADSAGYVPGSYLDVSGDDILSPRDVLFVVTALNEANSSSAAAGEPDPIAVDLLFADDDDDDDDDGLLG